MQKVALSWKRWSGWNVIGKSRIDIVALINEPVLISPIRVLGGASLLLLQ